MNHQDRRALRSQQPADSTFSIFEGQAAGQAARSADSLHPKGSALNLHRTRRLALAASARARQAWAIARKRRPKLRALARAAAPSQPASLRGFRLGALLACGVLSAALHSAWAAPVVIQNQFLRVGINEIGTLGTGGAAPPGIQYDPTGSGNFGGLDLLVPHKPTEGFVLTTRTAGNCNISWPIQGPAAQHCQFSLNGTPSGTSFVAPTSPVLTSASSATWSAVSVDGQMGITNEYRLWTAGALQVIGMTTTVTALNDIEQLYFLRFLDADPDGALSSPFYDTYNGRFSDHLACATSMVSTLTACINSSSPVAHRTAVFESTYPLDPVFYLPPLPPTDQGAGDKGLGMAFSLGSFAVGQSKTFTYEYLISGSPFQSTVPEPGSVGLAGLALCALGLARRKKPAAVRPV